MKNYNLVKSQIFDKEKNINIETLPILIFFLNWNYVSLLLSQLQGRLIFYSSNT